MPLIQLIKDTTVRTVSSLIWKWVYCSWGSGWLTHKVWAPPLLGALCTAIMEMKLFKFWLRRSSSLLIGGFGIFLIWPIHTILASKLSSEFGCTSDEVCVKADLPRDLSLAGRGRYLRAPHRAPGQLRHQRLFFARASFLCPHAPPESSLPSQLSCLHIFCSGLSHW